MSKKSTKSTHAKTERVTDFEPDLESSLCRADRKMQLLVKFSTETDQETLCDLIEDVADDVHEARRAFYNDFDEQQRKAEKDGTR